MADLKSIEKLGHFQTLFIKSYQKISLTVLYTGLLVLITLLTAIMVQYISLSNSLELLVKLSTSPFNAYFEGEYLWNIVYVATLLVIAEVYLKFRGQERLAAKALGLSIVATYTVSFAGLVDFSNPGAGSSIVGFSVLVFVAAYFVYDIIRFSKRMNRIISQNKNVITHRKEIVGRALVYCLAFLMAPFIYYAFMIEYTGYIAKDGISLLNPHILGLLAFALLFVFYEWFARSKQEKAEVKGEIRCV